MSESKTTVPRRRHRRNVPGRVAAILLAAALVAAGCTNPGGRSQGVTTVTVDSGSEVTVTFPGRADLDAKVETAPAVEPDLTFAGAVAVLEAADFTVANGDFPETGAEISFTRDEDLPETSVPVIAHWNDAAQQWEPAPTTLSDDRRTITAQVSHFSVWAVLEVIKDAAQPLIDGARALTDQDVREDLYSAAGQALGALAKPPECDGITPEWADPHFFDHMNNNVLWCTGSSPEDDDVLIVKAALNRNYAGFFTLPFEPETAPRPEGAAEDFDIRGALHDGAGDVVFDSPMYPVGPLSEWEFTFTKAELIAAWPELKANDSKLITFETTPWMTGVGLAISVMDLAVTGNDGNPAKALKLLGIYLMTLDCFRDAGYADDIRDDPSSFDAEQIPTMISCVALVIDNMDEVLTELAPRAGIDPDTTKSWAGKLNEGAKLANKFFRVLAVVQAPLQIATMLNDFDSELINPSLTLNPAAGQHREFETGTALSTYTTVDGLYQFQHPADWTVVVDPPSDIPGSGSTVRVLDPSGRTMGALTTGFAAILGAAMIGQPETVELDYQEMPAEQVGTVYPDTVNSFNYQKVYMPATGEVGATMSINNMPRDGNRSWLRGFDIDPKTGGAFSRWIGGSDDLPGIDPSLKGQNGTEMFEAYQQTPEYEAVKTMLLSLRRVAG